MNRIVSRNGLRYDNPGSTRGAEEHKKSGHMTAKNPVYNSIFKNGAKETRTPDPLHAMQYIARKITTVKSPETLEQSPVQE